GFRAGFLLTLMQLSLSVFSGRCCRERQLHHPPKRWRPHFNKRIESTALSNLRVLRLSVTYTEKSPSATGVHVITAGSLPKNCKGMKRPHHDGFVEIYSRGRFFTMTGDSIGDYSTPCDDTATILELYKRIGGHLPVKGNGDSNGSNVRGGALHI